MLKKEVKNVIFVFIVLPVMYLLTGCEVAAPIAGQLTGQMIINSKYQRITHPKIKSSQDLGYTLDANLYDHRSAGLTQYPLSLKKVESVKGYEYLLLKSSKEMTDDIILSPEYFEEYLHLIDVFLKKDSSNMTSDFVFLGAAHNTRDKVRMGFGVFKDLDSQLILGLRFCVYGYCDLKNWKKKRTFITLNKESAKNFSDSIKNYSNKFLNKHEYPEYIAGDSKPNDPSKALVYLYRLKTFPLAVKMRLSLNGEKTKEKLKSIGYTSMELSPGNHTFSFKNSFALIKKSSIDVNLEANKVYFIKYTPDYYDGNLNPPTVGTTMAISADFEDVALRLEDPVIARNDMARIIGLRK